MPKDEWGVKRVCPSCNTRFYDLNNDPMTCPSCTSSFTLESLTSDRPKALEKSKPEEDQEDDVIDTDVVLDDDSDDDLGVDDDLLEEDDDDSVSLEEIADVPADDDEG